MKTISRQRKKQLSLKARGLCRYSEAHGPSIIRGMCYDCLIRHRKLDSPHIPEWWPVSVHYSNKREAELRDAAHAFDGSIAAFCRKYDPVIAEVHYAMWAVGAITPYQLGVALEAQCPE